MKNLEVSGLYFHESIILGMKENFLSLSIVIESSDISLNQETPKNNKQKMKNLEASALYFHESNRPNLLQIKKQIKTNSKF